MNCAVPSSVDLMPKAARVPKAIPGDNQLDISLVLGHLIGVSVNMFAASAKQNVSG
jgi:hypothetical protein